MAKFTIDKEGFVVSFDPWTASQPSPRKNKKSSAKPRPETKNRHLEGAMQNALLDIRRKLDRKVYQSQEQIWLSLVARIIQKLGWNIWDPAEVDSGFRLPSFGKDALIDVVLYSSNKVPAVSIKITASENWEDVAGQQAGDDAPFGIITTGQVWRFFYSSTARNFSWERFRKLDLLADPVEELERSFITFLSKQAILNGTAEKKVLSNLQSVQKQRTIEKILPEAQELIKKFPFPSLPQAIVQRAAAMNVSLTEEEVIRFLSPQESKPPVTTTSDIPAQPPRHVPAPSRKHTPFTPGILPPNGTSCRFRYKGKDYFGEIRGNRLVVPGYEEFASFSGASLAISGTQRNGWRDWECKLPDTTRWIPADQWRKRQKKQRNS